MNHILTQILFENNIIDEKIYSFQALLEDRIDFIKKQHNGQYDALIDHIAKNIDPTKNKKYTQWVLNRSLAGDHIPDANTVKSSLEWYDKASPKSHDHDINKHDMQSMMDIAHLSKTSPKSNKTTNNIDKIYDKDGVTAYKVNDKQSMINLYGPGRKYSATWCTSAAGNGNAFDRYDGGKYTIHYPNGEYMHFHHQSEQTKDASNTEIDFSSDKRYKDYNKNTREILEQTSKAENTDNSLTERHFGISDEKFNSAFQHFKNVSKYGPEADNFKNFVGRNKLNDEQFTAALKHGTLTKKVYQNPHLTDDQVSTLLDNHNNADWVEYGLHRNPAVRGHNVDRILNEFENNPNYKNYAYKLGAIKNLKSHHIDDIIEKSFHDKNYKDAIGDIVENEHKFSTSQINRLMDNEDHRHVIKIAEHQTIPIEHLKTVLNPSINNGQFYYDPHIINMTKIMDNNNIDDNIIHGMIDKSGAGIPRRLTQILDSKNVKRNHIDHIVNLYRHANFVPDNIITHKNITQADLDQMLFDNPNKGYNRIFPNELMSYISRKDSPVSKIDKANSKNYIDPWYLEKSGYYDKKDFNESHFDDQHHAYMLLRNLDKHPEFTHKQIGKLINTTSKNTTYGNVLGKVSNSILNHPNVSPENIKDLYRHTSGDNAIVNLILNHKRSVPSVKKDIEEKYGYK